MSFKLLAIRPMKGCSIKILKNLQINCIYKFYEEAIFYSDKEIIISNSKSDQYLKVTDIFDNGYDYLPKNFFYHEKISVSAIVGKNGSGKSSLIDLFVACVNQLAFNQKEQNKLITSAELIFLKQAEKICCEIFYQNNQDYYCLSVNGNIISITNIKTGIEVSLEEFFYTNIINYSIHSNNSNEIGRWIDRLFHKNDSYQIPIVLNPKRENYENKLAGVIDINNESFLLTQRLLSLLIANNNFLITENLAVEEIYFKYKNSKNFTIIVPKDPKISKRYTNEVIKKSDFKNYFRDDVGFAFTIEKKGNIKRYYYGLPSLLEKFKKSQSINDIDLGENQYRFDIYICYKIISICEKYHFFQDVLVIAKKRNLKDYERGSFDLSKFLTKFINSDSHIIVKLLQVVNYFKNYDLLWENVSARRRISLKLLSDQLNNLDVLGSTLISKLPPPLFEVELRSSTNVDILSSISSGEKQLVHSISSILYHISNLNSVEKEEGIIKYRNVNIILDEIELYFHPEFQRCFLDRLLDGLIKINTETISGINILIISHSPFILSDIPKQNVLFLESIERQSTPMQYSDDNTFAENIHEILNKGFFLTDTKGAFAKNKIDVFLKFYYKVINGDESSDQFHNNMAEYNAKKQDFEKLVNLVGENYIRSILQNHIFHLDKLFIPKETIIAEKQRAIDHLQSEINLLKDV